MPDYLLSVTVQNDSGNVKPSDSVKDYLRLVRGTSAANAIQKFKDQIKLEYSGVNKADLIFTNQQNLTIE